MIDPTVVRCDLCKSVDDVHEGRIVARECHVCGVCKRALYGIKDGARDPELPTDEARALADQLGPLWIAFRDIQRQIDAAVKQHRDELERARLEQIRVTREQEELAREAAEKEAAETMRIAEAIAEQQEKERAEQLAAAKQVELDEAAAQKQAIADLTASLAETKVLLASLVAAKG